MVFGWAVRRFHIGGVKEVILALICMVAMIAVGIANPFLPPAPAGSMQPMPIASLLLSFPCGSLSSLVII